MNQYFQARGIVAVLLVLGSLPCKASPPPELRVSPLSALVDEVVQISVAGLAPSQPFTVRATTKDQRQRPWVAEATYLADSQGHADLAELTPEPGGSYEGRDPMGLFWSATPGVEGAQIAHRVDVSYPTELELIVGSEVVGRQTVTRRFKEPGTDRMEVAENGIVGVYYRPPGKRSLPGIVVFAGSDGGLDSAEWRASLLASRGFAALAVAVFGYEGRPDHLVEIPLEDLAAAVSWLAARPETGPLGALGFSKGAELALSLAARDSRIRAVVAISPSSYVWPGISDGPPEKRSSWSFRGTPLPAIPWSVGPAAGAMFASGPPFRLRVLYEESLAAAPENVRQAAAIPVANLRGPLLLVSGGDDGSWPAAPMSQELVAWMTAAGRAGEVTHLDYPEAGHLIFWGFLPVAGSDKNSGQVFGGTPIATSRARADSWLMIQAFLQNALRE